MELQTYRLPTIAEILEEKIEQVTKVEQLNFLLSQDPPARWIKEHPYIKQEVNGQKVPYKYLPIDKIEYLLRKIFKKYQIEITDQGTSFNGVWVTVRIHYFNPATGEMDYHDGIGAEQLQTRAGMSAADLANINNGAISMAFPKAKTAAIKDACDHFGNMFGGNLNRRDTINFNPDQNIMYPEVKLDPIIQESLDLITDIEGLDKYIWQLTSSDKNLNKNMAFRSAIETIRKKLTPKTN
ncbi:MAG: hypothetical protein V4538_16150 [Bacteroidota bacterium]